MSNDILGLRGEAIFSFLITEYHTGRGEIFRPQFLGDKWPSVDFIVQLIGAGSPTPFFFVQVKTTRSGLTETEGRLKVHMDAKQIAALVSYPAPTYIVGVNAMNEAGYIVSANGEESTALSSLNTSFPLDYVNRERLWTEVQSYWAMSPTPKMISVFRDVAWR